MPENYKPKITIITPSYNQGKYIRTTIDSISAQQYQNFEHIVVDGGSTDDTLDILKSCSHIKWLSEKDKGQSDALSKGLKLATGVIIGWINSDDYYEQGIFNRVAEAFNDPNVNWVVSNITYQFDLNGSLITNKTQKITYDSLLANADLVRQQGAFYRKEFLISAGGWDPQYYMVMDYDLWVRLARRSAPLMVDENWAFFRFHADQKTSLKNILRQEQEILGILKRENANYISRFKVRLVKRKQWIKGLIKEQLIKYKLLDKKYASLPIREK